MNTLEASQHMATHAGDKPLRGYFVQRRKAGHTNWENMALAWDTIAQAYTHAQSLSDDLGGEYRVCERKHTVIGLLNNAVSNFEANTSEKK